MANIEAKKRWLMLPALLGIGILGGFRLAMAQDTTVTYAPIEPTPTRRPEPPENPLLAWENWDCGRINNPDYPNSFDPEFPVTRNAFRVLYEQVGMEGLDEPPYLEILEDGTETEVWYLEGLNHEHNGNAICAYIGPR